jgi:hypothetical protein
MIDYVDIANRRWTIRRTCIDTPSRAYAARLVDDLDDNADLLPGVIGFYAETIADIRHKLNGGN